MRLLASDDFLYDTVDVAIWSTVEQGMAITAGGLATLQPLLKIIAFKLGLRSHPSQPNPSNYGNKIRLQENAISVRRSFTHKSEPFSPSHKTSHDDQDALNLQPGAAGYSAMCYNTSQELLAIPTRGSDGEQQPKDLEAGAASRDEREGIPAAYIPHSPTRLARFRSGDK